MANDLLTEEIEDTLPIFRAFDREVPERLETPGQVLNDWVGELDRHIHQFEELAQKSGSEASMKRAQKYRADFSEFEKKSLKELGAKKKDDKKLDKLTDEARASYEEVDAELEVPAREQRVTEALNKFKGRQGVSEKAVTGFEKQQTDIANEKDAKKRLDKYVQLERDIIKADLLAREVDEPGSTWQNQVEIALQDAKPVGRIGKVGKGIGGLKNKILRKAPPEAISAEDFLALKTAFINSYKKKYEDMAFGVPDDKQEEFKGKVQDLITALANEAFDVNKKPADRQQLGKLLMVSNTKALQRLMALKRDYPPNVTPQVMVEDGKLVIIKQAPKPQSLVLQGGGSKGAGYPPMLEEMKTAGLLDKVDLLVGTSIGALNSSCLACGGLADERQILDMPVFKQVYDAKSFKKQYPDVTFGTGTIWPTCAGQMAKIDQMTASSIADNLKGKSENDISNELADKLHKLDDEMLAKMGLKDASTEEIQKAVQLLAKKVKNQDFKGGDRMSQMITFKDLAMLHQLDPVNFKELTITGWEMVGDEGHVEYFNAQNFGDMPIALAARISMGLPIFAPVYWKGRGPFYDGGLGSNAPVEVTPGLDEFYKDKDPGDAEDEMRGDVPVDVQEAMAKTMLMTFDDSGKGERNLYGEGRHNAPPTKGRMSEESLVIEPGLNRDYAKTLQGDATKVYNTGVNTLQVYHGAMDTVTILPSDEDFEYAENMSRMKGLEQLDARQDQAALVKCTNSDEALLGMSSADKRNLVKAGKPQGGDPMVLELYDKCAQFMVIEDASQQIGDDADPFLTILEQSPLCAPYVNDIKQLHMQYNLHAKGNSNLEALTQGIKSTSEYIAACPAYIRPMLKQAVLLPMQQRKRGMPKPKKETELTFLWQQQFSADAFDRSMTEAKTNSGLEYLKQATAVLDALKKYEKVANEPEAKKDKPKERCEAARKALTAAEVVLTKLRIMAGVNDYADVPTLLEYIRWLEGQAGTKADELRGIVKGKDAVYPAQNFVAWNKKDLETKMELAVKAGALEDPGSTGLGSVMEKAEKASTAAQNAGDDEKEKTGRAAWNAWDRLVRKAKEVQGMTDNPNFTAYLQQCVTQATQQRDRFPPP